MEENNWLKALTEKAEQDPYYQECLAQVRGLEPLYLNIRSSLPGLQRKALDAYISACEEPDHALLLLAKTE